jgi:hypothetical protein
MLFHYEIYKKSYTVLKDKPRADKKSKINVVMLSVIMLIVVMLNVVILSVIMLIVVAPSVTYLKPSMGLKAPLLENGASLALRL